MSNKPIIKIYDLGNEEYQISISKKIGREEGYKIIKELIEIYEEQK